MTEFLSQYWPDFLFVLALQVVSVLVIRTFPDVLGGSLLRVLEHRNAKSLEKTKDELTRATTMDVEKIKDELARATARDIEGLRADYSSLRASTDYLSTNQAELRSRMIAATATLWNQMIVLRREFGGVINLETIFLPKELAEMFEQDKHQTLRRSYSEYADEQCILQKIQMSMGDEIEGCRLFVGDRLWLTFYVFRAAISRIAFMTNVSFRKSKYKDWRKDDPTLRMLQMILPESTIKETLESSLPALTPMIGNLEAHFLKEAMRIMSGSKVLADHISDVQATIAYETIRVREGDTSSGSRHGRSAST